MTEIDQKPMFLRPAEAAELAGLSTRAIYRAIQRGELRAVRLCSRLRIPRDGVRRVDRARRRSASSRGSSRCAPCPAARGSFRRLLAGDERRATS